MHECIRKGCNMISLERAASILNRLDVFTTVEGIKKRVLNGELKKASLDDNSRKWFASKFNYGIDLESFRKYLSKLGFDNETISELEI